VQTTKKDLQRGFSNIHIFSKIATLTPYQRTIKANVLLFMAGEFVYGIYVATGFLNQAT